MQLQMSETIEVLAHTPGVLDALLRGKSAPWLNAKKTPESFSAIDVLGHLIHAEMTDWIPRVRIILDNGGERAFEPFDRFAFQALIDGKSVGALLDEFAELRQKSLLALHDLGVGDDRFGLPGLHPEFGPVTLGELLAAWVVHDLSHLTQIATTMACEYRDAVGPWRAFISILK